MIHTNYVVLATAGGANCNADTSCEASSCTLNLDSVAPCLPPGDPDAENCCLSEPTTCLDQAQTPGAIAELYRSGIHTIVVGIPGSEAHARCLSDFAVNGGHDPKQGPDYYDAAVAGGVQALEQVFTSIAVQLVDSCTIALPTPPANLDTVNVAVDCELVSYDDPDSGWQFDDSSAPNRIILHGEICDRIHHDGARRIDTFCDCEPPMG
jgi:hypothetical protein